MNAVSRVSLATLLIVAAPLCGNAEDVAAECFALPQLMSIYAVSHCAGVFGPRIQDFVTGQPLQFLYLMASEFARQGRHCDGAG